MNAREQAQWKWDHVAKPLHSLGLLEDLLMGLVVPAIPMMLGRLLILHSRLSRHG